MPGGRWDGDLLSLCSADGTLVLQHHAQQTADRGHVGSLGAIVDADLEGQTPLFEEHSISIQQPVLGIVDVSGLGGHSVELQDLEVPSFMEGFEGRRPCVKTAKVKAVETVGDAVAGCFESLGIPLRTV